MRSQRFVGLLAMVVGDVLLAIAGPLWVVGALVVVPVAVVYGTRAQ